MTARRMAGVAAGAFALLVLARPPRPIDQGHFRDDDARRTPIERVTRVRDAAVDSLQSVERSIWATHMRDSVARALAAIPAAERNQVITDARIPAFIRQHLQTVYAESRARMTGSAMPLPVFVSLELSASDYALGRRLWLEPSQAGVAACALVARVQLSSTTIADERQLRRAFFRALSPGFPQPHDLGLCAFESAYGAPSQAVRAWLRQRNFLPVANGLDPSRPPRRAGFDNSFDAFAWWGSVDNGAYTMIVRACAAGHLAYCNMAITPVAAVAVIDDNIYATNWSRSYWWSWHGSPDLMNALATSLGPQKFGDLWHANESPPDAYRRLTGVPIDTLARRLLMGGAAPIRTGAAPTFGEVIAVLLIAAIFAGLSTLSHPRNRRL